MPVAFLYAWLSLPRDPQAALTFPLRLASGVGLAGQGGPLAGPVTQG